MKTLERVLSQQLHKIGHENTTVETCFFSRAMSVAKETQVENISFGTPSTRELQNKGSSKVLSLDHTGSLSDGPRQ